MRESLPVIPVFLGYVLSFIYIGIYWNNHHHHILALPAAFIDPRIACGLYGVVALIWLIPDPRIESRLRR